MSSCMRVTAHRHWFVFLNKIPMTVDTLVLKTGSDSCKFSNAVLCKGIYA
ncbi:hypothetical protein ANCCAN_25778, partial [Ancylostoma caninum]